MLRLLVFLSILHVACGDCDPTWDVVRDGECRGQVKKTYSCVPGTRPSSQYSQDCAEFCAMADSNRPFTIRNDEDQSYWALRAASSDYYNGLWIPLYCNNATKEWEWHDGSPLNYWPPKYDKDLVVACDARLGWIMDNTGRWKKTINSPSAIFCTSRVPKLQIRDDKVIQNPSDGLLYQINTPPLNWQNAQKTCKNQGAALVSIHNQQTNSFIRQLAVSNNASNGLFLGASVLEGDFTWADGSKWDYTNSVPGFPVSGQGDCLAMDTFSKTAQWNNTNCANNLPYACVHADPMITGPWKEYDEITSPGYPYDASIPAEYLLTSRTGRIQVIIEELQANSCCDFLILTDQKMGGNLVANLTGQIVDYRQTVYGVNAFRSNSNFMRVSWEPKGAKNVKGFRITFQSW